MTRLAVCYASGFAVFLLLADFGALSPLGDFVHSYPLLDKLVHFLIYGCLALVVNAALVARQGRFIGRAIVTGSIFALITSTVEEFSNAFVASRSCSLGDLAANYLGILCIGVLPLAGSREQLFSASERIVTTGPDVTIADGK